MYVMTWSSYEILLWQNQRTSLNKIFCIVGEIPRGFRFHCQAASKYKGMGQNIGIEYVYTWLRLDALNERIKHNLEEEYSYCWRLFIEMIDGVCDP